MLRALRNELATADHVDLIVAFLRYSGVRLLLPTLRDFFARGGRMRVVTTIYTGATELRAVRALARLGAEIRVSYETHGTRLHAKAWLLERASGCSTGLVGSSNLSHAALVDGLEWNVRLGAVEHAGLVDRFRAWLFVRERPKDERNVAPPYLFLGPVRYVSHTGERPMSITWALEFPMPAAMYARAKVAAG
jgi:HKD family nuclease